MQKKTGTRAGFGTLFLQGMQIYKRSLGATAPAVLLLKALPSLLAKTVVFYAAVVLLRPMIAALGEIIRSAFTYGFDETALEQAIRQMLRHILSMDQGQVQALAGCAVGVALILVPLMVVTAIFLQPLGDGIVARAQLRAGQGEKASFRETFGAVKGNYGRLILLSLSFQLGKFGANAVLSGVTGILSVVVALLPFSGIVAGPLSLAVSLVLAAASVCIWNIQCLIGVNEGIWHFEALFAAFKRFFTDWRHTALYLVYGALLAACSVVTVVLDIVARLCLVPPVFTILLGAFAAPMISALNTAVYLDRCMPQGDSAAAQQD